MVKPTGKCWCGCGADCNSFFANHDQRALFSALEVLGYDRHNMIAVFLEAHGFQPGGGREHELRAAVVTRYGSR